MGCVTWAKAATPGSMLTYVSEVDATHVIQLTSGGHLAHEELRSKYGNQSVRAEETQVIVRVRGRSLCRR